MNREIDHIAKQLFHVDHPDKEFEHAPPIVLRSYELKALTHIINREQPAQVRSEKT